MIIQLATSLFIFLWTAVSFAFPCILTFVKDNCWRDYDVTIRLLDSQNEQQLFSLTVPKGKLWKRVNFQCKPKQQFIANVNFSPAIWEGDDKKIYPAKNYVFLPTKIEAGQSAWNIPICYPQAFSGLPATPTATSQCACDFANIPAIPLLKVK